MPTLALPIDLIDSGSCSEKSRWPVSVFFNEATSKYADWFSSDDADSSSASRRELFFQTVLLVRFRVAARPSESGCAT